ncbi:MAG: hypothetical protein H6696_09130 [Deferribacteres bacterium]|nr:hypothetical protein [candidate division KSB1 bacterium]MCB9502088.1 hypothetical protein [Deferribacteres bacterium]
MALYLILIGYFIDVIMRKQFPDINIVKEANKYLIIVLLLLLILRIFFEKLPQADFHFFLCLPISKKDIIISYIIRLLGKKLNIIPYFVLIPFWFKNIFFAYSITASLYWLLGSVILSFCFALLGLLMKFIFFEFKWFLGLLVGLVVFTIFIDYSSALDIIKAASTLYFDSLLQSSTFVVFASIIVSIPFIFFTYKALYKMLYLDYD